MSSKVPSSLDRFLSQRATVLACGSYSASLILAQAIIGWSLLGMAGTLAVIALVTRDYGPLIGATGPLVGGLTNVIVSMTTRRRAGQLTRSEVKMSPTGRAFLMGLVRQVCGWRHSLGTTQYVYDRHDRRRAWGTWGNWYPTVPVANVGTKRSEDYLEATAFQVFDQAARHYNRIQGYVANKDALAASGAPQSPAAVLLAADQTMIEVVERVAIMQRLPESADVVAQEAWPCVSMLKEAADRLESIGKQSVELAPSKASRSLMDRVLEDLRLEDLARSELSSENKGQEHQQQRHKG